jgi:glycosyltransferase involved in cell wall biosynthesis
LKKVLFISLDGMTDPLGQSQVLPYLQGLSKEGYHLTIISFEKTERYEKGKSVIDAICQKSNIHWVPLEYKVSPPVLSKAYNRIKMFKTAEKLHQEHNFSLIHCRSYGAGEVGMHLKKKFGVPFLFDMRGFWADEKKDGHVWPQDKWVYRQIYKHYKKQEKALIQSAAHIISLTYAGKREIETWSFYDPSVSITVIPCCADMTHFSLNDSEQKSNSRKALNIDEKTFVVSYLGSIGSWYMLDEMLQLFKKIKEQYNNALFFLITPSNARIIFEKATDYGIAHKDILVKEASRIEVPLFMKASDITLSFIKPTYSKKSSSPTKLGEVMGMGIPVITNDKVGDVAEIVEGKGIVLQDFDINFLNKAITEIPMLLRISPADIRTRALEWFDLEKGITQYTNVYKTIIGKTTYKQ